MKAVEADSLTGSMSPEERATVVVALDHDARQPQHAVEMALRNLRLIVGELERVIGAGTAMTLLSSMKGELGLIRVAFRQVVDAQRDLIDAIRLEVDDTKPILQRISAEEPLERVAHTNRGLAGKIELKVARTRIQFFSDERWVERMLNNLLVNAIRHSRSNRVLLTARRRSGMVMIEVRDNGCGMSSEKVAMVFDPVTVPALTPIGYATARSGLGMYNVRLFASRLGGQVDCISHVGRGTLFRVTLPGPTELTAREAKRSELRSSGLARNKLVAILDDDLALLRTFERALERVGAEVYADHDPLRWLSVVTDWGRAPDLIVVADSARGQDCKLQIDIVRRKWSGDVPKVILLCAPTRNDGIDRAWSGLMLRKPIQKEKVELVLDVLSGVREVPNSGWL